MEQVAHIAMLEKLLMLGQSSEKAVQLAQVAMSGETSECLRAGTFEGKNPCPEGANTSVRLSIYTGTPI
jgi:hypothetical protein